MTGVRSGLGKALHQEFPSHGLARDNSAKTLEELRGGVDFILHCAFQTERQIAQAGLAASVTENLNLLESLLKIPHRGFLFLSSIDVYEKDGEKHDESGPLTASGGVYPRVKLLGEEMVLKSAKSPLVLRSGSLLGRYSRKGNVLKLIDDANPVLSLTASSSLHIVLHESVAEITRAMIERGLSGVFNVVAKSPVTLCELAAALNKTPSYGSFHYDAGQISNEKANAVAPSLSRSSLEAVKAFIAKESAL